MNLIVHATTSPNQSGKKRTTVIALSIMMVIVFVASVAATIFWKKSAGSQSALAHTDQPDILGELTIEPPVIPDELHQLNIVLLGYGGPGHQGGYLSDVIQLVHIDFDQKKIAAISIPRDLWIELPNGSAGKINGAFSLGSNASDPVGSGGPVAAAMAEAVTGLEVQYFAAVDFVGFERLIGQTLDGLEVTVTEPFEDPWYPIRGKELEPCGHTPEEIADLTVRYSGFELEKQFPCRYEHLKFPAGSMSMEGGDALRYVRSRHGSGGGDFSRSKRQHDVLLAIRDRLFSLQTLADIPQWYEAITEHVTTNLDLKAAEYIGPVLTNGKEYELKGIVLSTENVFTNGKSSSGQYILQPKSGWKSVHDYVQSQL